MEGIDSRCGCEPGAVAGLRERKKQATREALGAAAIRLAIERGVDKVRVGDIAAAAGVSTRTYNNYFSSREQAICALGADRTRRLVDALRARPHDEPLAEALRHAVTSQVARAEPDKEMFRLIWSDPTVRAEFLRTVSAVQGGLASEIAARTGLDAERDVTPRVVAAAYEGAARAATTFWLRPDCTQPLAEVLHDALSVVAPVAEQLGAPARPPQGRVGGAASPARRRPTPPPAS